MNSILPIDGVKINDVGYGAGLDNTCKFIAGSGSITANAEITRSVTECGDIIYRQLYKDFTVSANLVGDYTALNTDAPDQDKIEVSYKGKNAVAQTLLTIYGVVAATYEHSTNETSLSITGKIAADPEPLTTAAIVAGTSGS